MAEEVTEEAPEVTEVRRWGLPQEFIEHSRNARHEMREAWRTLLPEGFWEHRRAARREMLLAVRSLVDAAFDRMMERAEAKPETRRRPRKTRIEVQ